MKNLFIIALCMSSLSSLTLFAQVQTNPSIGLQYKHFPKSKTNGNNSSIGINAVGNLFPEEFTTIDYDARIGVVTEGVINGKKFIDVNLELGASAVLIAKAHYKNNPNLHSVGGAIGMGLGHGDEYMGTGGYLGFEINFNKDFRNTFIEENTQNITYSVTSYKQKENDVIISENILTPQELVELNPDSFNKTIESKTLINSTLKSLGGGGVSFYGTMIPLRKGSLSFSGKVRSITSTATSEDLDNLAFKSTTGSKKVDVGGGVLVDQNYHVYSDGQGTLVNEKVNANYERLDIFLQLAYSKAKVRIWVEPTYNSNHLEILKNALNLKSINQKNFGFTVGINYHLFQK